MSKIIQCTVGLIVTLAVLAAGAAIVWALVSVSLWLYVVAVVSVVGIAIREEICLLGETVLTLAKAIWSKP